MLIMIKQEQKFKNQKFYKIEASCMCSHRIQNILIPGMGIKEGKERVTNVTRIITSLKDDSTVRDIGRTVNHKKRVRKVK